MLEGVFVLCFLEEFEKWLEFRVVLRFEVLTGVVCSIGFVSFVKGFGKGEVFF